MHVTTAPRCPYNAPQTRSPKKFRNPCASRPRHHAQNARLHRQISARNSPSPTEKIPGGVFSGSLISPPKWQMCCSSPSSYYHRAHHSTIHARKPHDENEKRLPKSTQFCDFRNASFSPDQPQHSSKSRHAHSSTEFYPIVVIAYKKRQ